MLVIIGGGIYVVILFIVLLAFYSFIKRLRTLLKSMRILFIARSVQPKDV